MAVAFHLDRHLDRHTLAEVWLQLIERHGTLRTAFIREETAGSDDQDLDGEDASAMPSATTPASDEDPAGAEHRLSVKLHEITVSSGQWEQLGHGEPLAEDDVRRRLREHFDVVCDPFARPSHRLCVIEDPQGVDTPQVVIGADHAHVDAWSLLVLARDFSAYAAGVTQSSSSSPSIELPAAENFAAHTADMATRPTPPAEVISRWQEILHTKNSSGSKRAAMPHFPLNLGDLSQPVEEVVEIRDIFDTAELASVEEYCSRNEVRLVAVAVSVMTRLAGEFANRPLRTVFPVHSRHDPRWFNSVGWFITNSVLENDDMSYTASYQAVKEAVTLGSYPLGPIMEPYGGMPQEPGMFAVSWLDYRKLPVQVPDHAQPQHISASIRTDGVMIWFVINGTGLHVRCRYPDTREARQAMGTWLPGLVDGLRSPLEHEGIARTPK